MKNETKKPHQPSENPVIGNKKVWPEVDSLIHLALEAY